MVIVMQYPEDKLHWNDKISVYNLGIGKDQFQKLWSNLD